MTNHTLSLNTGIFGDTYTYVGSAHLNQWHAERAERQQQAARAKAALRQQTREQEALELSAQGTARVDHWFQNSARRQPAAQGTAGMAWMDTGPRTRLPPACKAVGPPCAPAGPAPVPTPSCVAWPSKIRA